MPAGEGADAGVWGCVLVGLSALAVILYTLLRAPGKPQARPITAYQNGRRGRHSRVQSMQGDAAAAAAAAVRNPFAASDSGSGGGSFVAAPIDSSSSSSSSSSFDLTDDIDLLDPANLIIRDQKLRRQSRLFLLCVAVHGVMTILFLTALLMDSWERAEIATYIPTVPTDPHVHLVRFNVVFGLGGRRVGEAHEVSSGNHVSLNGTLFDSGSYSRLCVKNSSLLGCSMGSQVGVGTVVAYTMLGLACSMVLLAYLIMAPKCPMATSSSPSASASSVAAAASAADSRNMFLSATWRAALVGFICIVVTPLIWIASFHWSLSRQLIGDGGGSGSGGSYIRVRLGPSWIVSFVAALLAIPALFAVRRALQLLHSEDDTWTKVRAGSLFSNRGNIEHRYRAPMMQLTEHEHEHERERDREEREFTLPAGVSSSGGGGAGGGGGSIANDPEVADAGLAYEQHLLRPERISLSPNAQRIMRPTAAITLTMPSSEQQQREQRLLEEALEEL